ncbi:hypothetical protein L0222_28930 [bacterium]|nr:hypothetical protein [bacterium]MCI0601711.1 hypothetical protein [bacterium]
MYEIGMEIEAWCGQCKVYRRSAITTLNADGSIDRVSCLYCNSSRNYRPPADEKASEPSEPVTVEEDHLTALIRAVLREELELGSSKIAEKWIGGKLILRPGKPGLQEKEVPIDAFFHKIIMLRDRLRVLEQQINANDKLSEPEKIQFQQYITRCYGSLTTFNIFFKEQKDQFVGQKSD